MKLIDGKIYLSYADVENASLNADYLTKARSMGTKRYAFIDHPDDKRKWLIDADTLNDEYKKKVEARYGNLNEYLAKVPIRNMVKWDGEAEKYFLAYRYDDDKALPTDHVKKYTVATNWLNMFKTVAQDKKALKKLLNLTIEQFYVHVIEIIKADKIDLPTSYRRLVVNQDSALKKYLESGYSSLIDWRFGNKIAAKIKDELSESVLLEMIAHHNQFDDVYIAMKYNEWALQNNYKTIVDRTVTAHRLKKEHLIIMEREGNAALNEKYIKQVKGHRPTAPLFMVESDDNHLDFLFIDPNDETAHKHYHKYKAIVVIDSYNDYVLGYAYAEKMSPDLVRAAYLNAMYHLRSITGSWYLPHETKTDRWAIKDLEPFYAEMGKYFKTPVGSKHRGYIEQFFRTPHWKRCQKIGAINYTGNNMTAKFAGVNKELLERNKKDRPLIGNEAFQQIEDFFYRLRFMPQSNGINKHDQWLTAWNEMPTADKRMISDEQFLLKFGIKHNNNGNGYRITNAGVKPQINKIKYNYDLLTDNLMEYIGKPVSIMYDPFDMSRVLVTDFEQVRLMAHDARLNPRALKDTKIDSRLYLNASFKEKEGQVDYIVDKSNRRKMILASAGVDGETLLQAGVMDKSLRQEAEQKVLVPMNRTEDYYDQM